MDTTAPHSAASEAPAYLREHPRHASVPALSDAEYRVLRADIKKRGLLTPLEVTAARVVLDGHQRLRAARELCLEQVPVRIVSAADELTYMLLAALRRRHLSASQRAALALELEEIGHAKAQASERRLANLGRGADVATLPHRGERTRELAARIAAVSARTVQDVATVKEADPALFEQVKAGTAHAARAARGIRQARLRAKLPPAPALPQGPFELILADPPWRSQNPDSSWAPENHYPTMASAEIEALAVPAAEHAVLFLWAVNCLLPEALAVMSAWGFGYRANIVWEKESPGIGAWVRNRHELLLIGRRGSFAAPEGSATPESTLRAPRREHSRKPDQVYTLIERMFPAASRLELFARGKPRPGWHAWGNEVTP